MRSYIFFILTIKKYLRPLGNNEYYNISFELNNAGMSRNWKASKSGHHKILDCFAFLTSWIHVVPCWRSLLQIVGETSNFSLLIMTRFKSRRFFFSRSGKFTIFPMWVSMLLLFINKKNWMRFNELNKSKSDKALCWSNVQTLF